MSTSCTTCTQPTPAHVLIERDAAAYVGMSVAWLRQGRMKNRGPSYLRYGRSVRYRIEDLDIWVNRHKVSTADAA